MQYRILSQIIFLKQTMYENCQIIMVRIQKDAFSQQILETIAAKATLNI